MGTHERLFWRELGCRRPATERGSRALEGSRPLAFERSFNSSEEFMKRLTQTAEFKGDAACVSNVTWTPDGQFLAAGGEDCRITIWEPGTRQLKQTMDMVCLASVPLADALLIAKQYSATSNKHCPGIFTISDAS